MLRPLYYNGGATLTMEPLQGSPVIDAGNNSLIPSGVMKDQTGFNRISNGTVDIGAIEYYNDPVIVLADLPQVPAFNLSTQILAPASLEQSRRDALELGRPEQCER